MMSDILIRALKTFLQGFLGALVVTLPNNDFTNITVLKSLLIGAVSAGISAMMNLILNYINKSGEINE